MKFADLKGEMAPPEIAVEEAKRVLDEHYDLTGTQLHQSPLATSAVGT